MNMLLSQLTSPDDDKKRMEKSSALEEMKARCRLLIQISCELNASLRLDDLLTKILGAANDLANTESSAIILAHPETGELHFVAANGPDCVSSVMLSQPIVIPKEGSIAGWVFTHGETSLIQDASQDPRFFSGVDSETGFKTKDILSVPLRAQDNIIGVLQSTNKKDGNRWTDEDIEIMSALAAHSTIAIQTARHFESELEKQRMEKELAIAQKIQADFLPRTLPAPSGWEIVARFQPANEVSGDFYDVFELDANNVGVIIADVCDKGAGSALFMALCRSLLRAVTGISYDEKSTADSALKAVDFAHAYLYQNHLEMRRFVTLCFGILNTTTGIMTYINAGHNPPIIIGRGGEIQSMLERTGPAVGLPLPDLKYETRTCSIGTEEMLLFYTDGITEARSPDGTFFGDDRLLDIIKKPVSSANDLLDDIESHLSKHRLDAARSDDITMVAVRRSN